jgi:7,8-dihydroneopterin 2',3'-cyclic phosphate phosphodiesterase
LRCELELLAKEFTQLVNKIHDKILREKTINLLRDPTFEVNGKINPAISLKTAPAGKSHHHAYPGGYIDHVVSSTKIALAMCDSVEKVYHGKVNRDHVIAGMLLHDVFKPATYSKLENGYYGSTQLADYMDHLSIATAELVRRNFPIELVHIVLAHHGEYGPMRPKTVEALVCHLADFADSRLNGEVLNAAAYLSRRAGGQELRAMTSKEAFEIVHSKAVEGWEGVTETVKKLARQRRGHKP